MTPAELREHVKNRAVELMETGVRAPWERRMAELMRAGATEYSARRQALAESSTSTAPLREASSPRRDNRSTGTNLREHMRQRSATIKRQGAVVLVEVGPRAPWPQNQASKGRFRVLLIRAGWGTSGYYSEALLKRDGAKTWPKGTKSFINHPTATEEAERPERAVEDWASVLTTDPVWDPVEKGLVAEVEIWPQWRWLLNEEFVKQVGLSIRATGAVEYGEAEGRQGPIVTSLEEGISVDWVTQAGAGGRVVALIESARNEPKPDSVDAAAIAALLPRSRVLFEQWRAAGRSPAQALTEVRHSGLIEEESLVDMHKALEESFRDLGLSPAAAKIAARGRDDVGVPAGDPFDALVEAFEKRGLSPEAARTAAIGRGSTEREARAVMAEGAAMAEVQAAFTEAAKAVADHFRWDAPQAIQHLKDKARNQWEGLSLQEGAAQLRAYARQLTT